jgi:hypothetical protein
VKSPQGHRGIFWRLLLYLLGAVAIGLGVGLILVVAAWLGGVL